MLHVPTRNVTTIVSGEKTTIACAIGDELIVTTREKTPTKKRNPRPQWISIGTGMHTSKFTSYPYELTLLSLTANETRMFILIREAYSPDTGLSMVNLNGYTPSQKTELSKGYKGLKGRNLVKRVKQKVYMINPSAIVHLELFDELYDMWINLV